MKRIVLAVLIVGGILLIGCSSDNLGSADRIYADYQLSNESANGQYADDFKCVAERYFLALAMKDYETSESLIFFTEELSRTIPPDAQRSLLLLRDTVDPLTIYKIEKLPMGEFRDELGDSDYVEIAHASIHYFYNDDRNVILNDTIALERRDLGQWYIALPLFLDGIDIEVCINGIEMRIE